MASAFYASSKGALRILAGGSSAMFLMRGNFLMKMYTDDDEMITEGSRRLDSVRDRDNVEVSREMSQHEKMTIMMDEASFVTNSFAKLFMSRETRTLCEDATLAETLEMKAPALKGLLKRDLNEKREMTETDREVDGASSELEPNAAEPFSTVSSYPNFSRHGEKSILRKHLTETVYNELKDKQTSKGVTLEDIIASGVSLPFGARPPRGVAGVYAGDEESYQTFSSLLTPIVEEYHKSAKRRNRLQRHRTNLSPQLLLQQSLDPDGEYILVRNLPLYRLSDLLGSNLFFVFSIQT